MIVEFEIDPSAPIPDSVMDEINSLKDKSITIDEDCPEITEEQFAKAVFPGEGKRVAVG